MLSLAFSFPVCSFLFLISYHCGQWYAQSIHPCIFMERIEFSLFPIGEKTSVSSLNSTPRNSFPGERGMDNTATEPFSGLSEDTFIGFLCLLPSLVLVPKYLKVDLIQPHVCLLAAFRSTPPQRNTRILGLRVKKKDQVQFKCSKDSQIQLYK